MKAYISPAPLAGNIQAIPSKSAAHRILLCSALGRTPVKVENIFYSEDITATIRCLRALGTRIDCTPHSCTVIPAPFAKEATLDCGESGSTLRFLLPLAAAKGGRFCFTLHGRLPQRPLSPLAELLASHGCKLSGIGKPQLYLQGQLTPGSFPLAGNVSSQFITALLLSLPLLGASSRIIVEGRAQSRPYIDLTKEIQSRFGIKTGETANTFYIHGNSLYRSPVRITVENDWSNAAFFLTAARLGCALHIGGLQQGSAQGDRAIMQCLLSPYKDVDAADIPDLVPILSVFFALTPGTHRIYNAKRLRLKESDRLYTTASMLRALGGTVKETEDGLIIRGCGMLSGGTVDTCGDHRIAMSAAIASIKCKNMVIIKDAQSVNKSYPGFWDDFIRLGGRVHLEDA